MKRIATLKPPVFCKPKLFQAGLLFPKDQTSGLLQNIYKALGLQIPSKKVLKPLKTPQSTFLEGVWSPKEVKALVKTAFLPKRKNMKHRLPLLHQEQASERSHGPNNPAKAAKRRGGRLTWEGDYLVVLVVVVWLVVCLFACLFVCLFVRLFVCCLLFVCLFVCCLLFVVVVFHDGCCPTPSNRASMAMMPVPGGLGSDESPYGLPGSLLPLAARRRPRQGG